MVEAGLAANGCTSLHAELCDYYRRAREQSPEPVDWIKLERPAIEWED